MRDGCWLEEERCLMPFHYDRVYTVEFQSKHGQIQVLVNGEPLTTFAERISGDDVTNVNVKGGVHVHSVSYL
ncbi:hypothetical protein OESDEN_16604 [Oesophagostomum dentatum]|uniref:Galectin n=1 Tax=Oesophagostomum dentatum TaxID=61180 RepID=A0A0B1SKI7_OESDE|nr:hypothetical protein OESDEN_16604 [Oesophagostomum dentatum]